MEIEIRDLQSHEEYLSCLELQKEVWGEDFTEFVPLPMLKITQRIGGVAAGAFDGEGRLLGFVFGMTGVQDGSLVHWSDMLAVSPAARDLGLGRRLKEYQRDKVREVGAQSISWTFDPLVARNGYFNLERLGASVDEYVEDMYGPGGSGESDLNLGTDRLIVSWPIENGSGRPSHCKPEEVRQLVRVQLGRPLVLRSMFEELPRCLAIEVPPDIAKVRSRSHDRVIEWRLAVREAFTRAFEIGYRVVGFRPPDGYTAPAYLLRSDVH